MTLTRAWILFAAIAAAGVALRVAALPGPGFTSDVGTFQAWAERLASSGPGGFYEPGYFADYPPGYLYVLWLLGALFDGEALRLAVKAVSIPFDVGIAMLLFRVVAERRGRATGVVAAAIWLLSPAPIVAGPFWGQVDAVGTLPLFASLVLAGRGRWAQAGALAAVATLIKPQFGIAAAILTIGALIELSRGNRRALLGPLTGVVTGLALALPFGVGPVDLLVLVRDAAANYPYTSLFAFNVWALLGGFWQPDDPYVLAGGVLLLLGLAASCLPLRRSRDVTAFLLAGGLATMAFYFLPTRAHERYLFPAFVLLLPLVIERRAALGAYLLLFSAFALTLLYAITRYPQNGIEPPALLDRTVFTDLGTSAVHVIVLVSAALLVDLIVRRPQVAAAVAPAPAPDRLPEAVRPAAAPPLGIGRRPVRRDIVIALAFALLVLVTRGYRLEQPREMYFDEVYHARTAFELLAEREPYEWTHPHLAKEIMAISILIFGGDRVVGSETLRPGTTALTVSNDGVRAFAAGDQLIVRARGTTTDRATALGEPARALAIDSDRVLALGARRLIEVPLPGGIARSLELPIGDPSALHVGGGRVIVGGSTGLAIYSGVTLFDRAVLPVLLSIRTVAVTGKPDGSEIYVLDEAGVVHVIDPATGNESRRFDAGRGNAIAYSGGPERLLVASSAAPQLAVVSLEGGGVDVVPLANARTGAIDQPARALATVPRADMVYAATGDHVVVIDPHGSSPFAAIAARGTLLGVDGEDDALLVTAADGAVSRIETGRHALAWRLPGVVAAALLAFLVVLLARRLFAATGVAVIAGIAILLDTSMFAQARIGMNDAYLALFIVAGWYFVVAAHAPRRSARLDLVLAGICFGLAFATKWAGAYAIAGMLVACLAVTARAAWRERPAQGGPLDLLAGRGVNAAFLFACFAIVPLAIYWLSYRPWFGGPTIPYGWDFVELTRQMYQYHSGLTSPHPAGSPWWSWPLVLKPVYWYYGAGPDASAVIYDAGNIVLFWAALPASVWLAITAFRTRSFRLAFVPFAMLVQLVAWVPITRVLFFYHFFTALPFYLLALATALTALWLRGRRAFVISLLSLAGAAFLFFYPFVSGLPVPVSLSSVFFVLPTWQYDCQFYPPDGGGLRCDPLGTVDAGQVMARLLLLGAAGAVAAAPFLLLRARAARERIAAG